MSTEAEARELKQRGILLATAGLVFALAVGLGLGLGGLVTVSPRDWLLALAITLIVQFALWLIPRRDWDQRLSWDPHYLYVPMVGAIALLNLYAYILPEAHDLLLMAWFVALIFMAGIATFREVVTLSGLMAAAHLGVIVLGPATIATHSVRFELVKVAVFFGICVYAAFVFRRLRRQRLEMRRLRRELAEQAQSDALTGLPNRRRFEELLAEELRRIERYGGSCSVALVDVDHFKTYNDTLGHPAGDRVLRELAEIFRRNLREPDVAARYGGEEFAFLLLETPVDEAWEVMERLRALVEAHGFLEERVQPTGQLTVSVGIAGVRPGGTSMDEVIERADRALYAAKGAGRNRVHLAA